MMKTTFTLICLMMFAGCSLDDAELLKDGSQAEESKQLEPPRSGATHCVIPTAAVPIGQPSSAVPPSVASPRCFASFSLAIDFATQGRVKLRADATPEDLDELAKTNVSPAASFVIGVEYQHAGYGGSTYTFYSNVTCHGYTHYVYSMPSGWNDIVSSARAYSYCNHSYHYEHVNFGGAVVDCHAGCSYIGDAMNDRTSSLFWTE